MLQERLYDFLRIEKGKEPGSLGTDLQETSFLTIGKGFEYSLRYHNKPASEKSFENCDCERDADIWNGKNPQPTPLFPIQNRRKNSST